MSDEFTGLMMFLFWFVLILAIGAVACEIYEDWKQPKQSKDDKWWNE